MERHYGRCCIRRFVLSSGTNGTFRYPGYFASYKKTGNADDFWEIDFYMLGIRSVAGLHIVTTDSEGEESAREVRLMGTRVTGFKLIGSPKR